MLLDTHMFIWWREGDARRLTTTDIAAIEAAPFLAASAATFYEVAQLIRRGRLPLDHGWPLRSADAFIGQGGVIIEADHSIMVRAGALDWDHGDPFDRLIVATAMERELDLATKDQAIAAFYPQVVG